MESNDLQVSLPLSCNPSRPRASFGIWDNNLYPTEITELLGVQPTSQRIKGEIHSTKDGGNAVSLTGCWILSSYHHVKSANCNAHLTWVWINWLAVQLRFNNYEVVAFKSNSILPFTSSIGIPPGSLSLKQCEE